MIYLKKIKLELTSSFIWLREEDSNLQPIG